MVASAVVLEQALSHFDLDKGCVVLRIQRQECHFLETDFDFESAGEGLILRKIFVLFYLLYFFEDVPVHHHFLEVRVLLLRSVISQLIGLNIRQIHEQFVHCGRVEIRVESAYLELELEIHIGVVLCIFVVLVQFQLQNRLGSLLVRPH